MTSTTQYNGTATQTTVTILSRKLTIKEIKLYMLSGATMWVCPAPNPHQRLVSWKYGSQVTMRVPVEPPRGGTQEE